MATGHIRFADAASEVGLQHFWQGGSKLPALTSLLELTLDQRRSAFCPLIETIVRAGIKYRGYKGSPYTREDLAELNRLVRAIGFKIPALWDPQLAETLPQASPPAPPASTQPPPPPPPADPNMERRASVQKLLPWFLALNSETDRQRAGRELERLLRDLFEAFGLDPRGGFVTTGEQIDGSIVLDGNSYLVEAKWEKGQVELASLLAFREKVSGKSSMTYGLFVSINGYSSGARDGLTRGRQPNFMMLDGRHLYAVLNLEVDLLTLLRALRRELADRGRPYVPLPELSDLKS